MGGSIAVKVPVFEVKHNMLIEELFCPVYE